MEDLKQQVTALAEIMDQFRLSEAELETNGQRIVFRRKSSATVVTHMASPAVHAEQGAGSHADEPEEGLAPEPVKQAGTPISSPMTGIFYTAPSPNSPPFVKEGDTVTAGQVVGLIEAMKVFNEITATTSGKVLSVVAEPGAIVQPGDPLLYVG